MHQLSGSVVPTALLGNRAASHRVASIEWFAEEATRTCGDVLESPDGSRRFMVGCSGASSPPRLPAALMTTDIRSLTVRCALPVLGTCTLLACARKFVHKVCSRQIQA
jgi:hypothetical protein